MKLPDEALAVLSRPYTPLRKFIDASLLVCLSLGGLYLGARVGLAPRDATAGVAVMFSPWTSAGETMARSVAHRGRFVRFGGVPFVAIVMPEDERYVGETLATGAWLVMDPRLFAACAGMLSPSTPVT